MYKNIMFTTNCDCLSESNAIVDSEIPAACTLRCRKLGDIIIIIAVRVRGRARLHVIRYDKF